MDIMPDTVDAAGFAADSVATILYPDDAPVNHVPVAVLGDGNCLYRAASVAVFGKENEHSNIRANVVKELVENVRYYAQLFVERG